MHAGAHGAQEQVRGGPLELRLQVSARKPPVSLAQAPRALNAELPGQPQDWNS